MTALAAKRRHPAAFVLVLVLALVVVGSVYAAFAPRPAQAASRTADTDQIAEGKKLFQANCSTCHGLNAEGSQAGGAVGDSADWAGPALAGVGAAAVDFQMGTGRMPMAQPGVQAPRSQKLVFTQEQIDAIAAYIGSLAPGPAIPSAEEVKAGDPARGGELFRVNCAMCHNSAGAGGALTRGKYAPSLTSVTPTHIYEAMLTGPQSMPVFNDQNISPDGKRDIIAFLESLREDPSQGGLKLGTLGPVSEGMCAWIFGMGALIGCAYWLARKGA